MQQLTGMDASFLALETATTTGHVGRLSVLDPSTASEPLTLARLTEVMAGRLPLVPVLRRKLLNVPFGLDQAYWVDDADFDIEYHVREIALPRPGSAAQLDEQVGRLHARPLDRSRPLWEIYLISGLARNRAAVYTKIHHAAVNGVSGTELLTVLFDLTPEGREPPAAKPFQPERPPSLPVLAAQDGHAAGLAPGADRADHERAGEDPADLAPARPGTSSPAARPSPSPSGTFRDPAPPMAPGSAESPGCLNCAAGSSAAFLHPAVAGFTQWTERRNFEDYLAWRTERGFTGTFEAMLTRPFVIHYYDIAYFGEGVAARQSIRR